MIPLKDIFDDMRAKSVCALEAPKGRLSLWSDGRIEDIDYIGERLASECPECTLDDFRKHKMLTICCNRCDEPMVGVYINSLRRVCFDCAQESVGDFIHRISHDYGGIIRLTNTGKLYVRYPENVSTDMLMKMKDYVKTNRDLLILYLQED